MPACGFGSTAVFTNEVDAVLFRRTIVVDAIQWTLHRVGSHLIKAIFINSTNEISLYSEQFPISYIVETPASLPPTQGQSLSRAFPGYPLIIAPF